MPAQIKESLNVNLVNQTPFLLTQNSFTTTGLFASPMWLNPCMVVALKKARVSEPMKAARPLLFFLCSMAFVLLY